MFTIGIYFLSFISLIKNKILTFFLHLSQKSAYNILLVSRKKGNEKVMIRYILNDNDNEFLFLQIDNE